MLEKKYIELLEKQGKNARHVEEQIQYFRRGFPYMRLIRPATVEDGIKRLTEKQIQSAIKYYDDSRENIEILKFVPASGAASRMFKDLFSYMNNYKGTEKEYSRLKADPGLQPVSDFFRNIHQFAFYDELAKKMKDDGLHLEERLLRRDYKAVLEYLLTEKGLNYGNLPKGLLKFHQYDKDSRTPVEEHLVEGALYALCDEDKVFIHFTVSPEHEINFKKQITNHISEYASKYNLKYDIQFSTQKPATDTIAVDLENNPFITEEGNILFRPGGHGALIENLNDLDSDVVFIKNIDNVVPDHLKDTTVKYKKTLAGILLEYQEKIFQYLNVLEEVNTLSPTYMEEIYKFIREELCLELAPEHDHFEAREFFISKLNRPIRVCGMVKNEGEPGGGPFWTKNHDKTQSLHIVESAQIDPENPEQQNIAGKATHFNPVDLVCGIKDFRGNKFDLTRYVDQQTGFISRKSMGGRDLKALELPGLWNGSMSNWNTVFVEVPIETFNPVKVVNDLLRDEHQ